MARKSPIPACGKTPPPNVFESRRLIPVADWAYDCCFIGVRETLIQQLLVQGKCWGETAAAAAPAASAASASASQQQAPAAAPAASAVINPFAARDEEFLLRVGAGPKSWDVHWPCNVHFRLRPGPETRASGLRRRSAAKIAKRNQDKVVRYGEHAFGRGRGGSSADAAGRGRSTSKGSGSSSSKGRGRSSGWNDAQWGGWYDAQGKGGTWW